MFVCMVAFWRCLALSYLIFRNSAAWLAAICGSKTLARTEVTKKVNTLHSCTSSSVILDHVDDIVSSQRTRSLRRKPLVDLVLVRVRSCGIRIGEF